MAPEVADVLTRFRITDSEMADLLLNAHQETAQAAVDHYLQSNPERVKYWITGEIGAT